MTTNLRLALKFSNLYAFGLTIQLFNKTCHFVPNPCTKHFVRCHVNDYKNFILVKVQTGMSSLRSHINLPISKMQPFLREIEEALRDVLPGDL